MGPATAKSVSVDAQSYLCNRWKEYIFILRDIDPGSDQV